MLPGWLVLAVLADGGQAASQARPKAPADYRSQADAQKVPARPDDAIQKPRRLGAGGTLNVVAWGADPTGKADCTVLLQELHARKLQVFYPNGTYRFNGETLDFTGGVTFESRDGVVVRNDLSPQPVVVFDEQGHLAGLQQTT